jgi:hypothetical protein
VSAINSLQTAEMRRGDFHLRRDDRQMFGNFVTLSAAGGEEGPLSKMRRSASVVATPVYDVPKFWWLTVEFADHGPPQGPLTPWVPTSQGSNLIRVKVIQALDRDKQTAVEVFDLQEPILSPAGSLHCLPRRLFAGHQITVTAEVIPVGNNSGPIDVQVSLSECTANERDAYGSAATYRFAQSDSSQIFLAQNPARRQFFVQNMGTSALYVAFHTFAVGPGLTALFTYALPNFGDVYESPRDGYQGTVSGVWATDGAADEDQALVTEGF